MNEVKPLQITQGILFLDPSDYQDHEGILLLMSGQNSQNQAVEATLVGIKNTAPTRTPYVKLTPNDMMIVVKTPEGSNMLLDPRKFFYGAARGMPSVLFFDFEGRIVGEYVGDMNAEMMTKYIRRFRRDVNKVYQSKGDYINKGVYKYPVSALKFSDGKVSPVPSKPGVIVFHMKRCPHCIVLEPTIGELSDKYAVYAMESEQIPSDVQARFEVKGYPTILLVNTRGDVVPYKGRTREYDEIEAAIKAHECA